MTLWGNTIKWLSCICEYSDFSQYGIARMQGNFICKYIVHVWFFLLIFRSTPCRLNVSFNEFPNARCVGFFVKRYVLAESQSSIEIQSCIKQTILQLSVEFRWQLYIDTLFWYRSLLCLIKLLAFKWEKQRGLYQSKVTSSLACIHWR